jgi:hypothetical protein
VPDGLQGIEVEAGPVKYKSMFPLHPDPLPQQDVTEFTGVPETETVVELSVNPLAICRDPVASAVKFVLSPLK